MTAMGQDTIESRRVAGHGLSLAADVAGDPQAQPVVFFHGGGQTRSSWGSAVSAMAAKGYYALSCDLRGHGESDWSPDGQYGLDRFVEDVVAVAKGLPRRPVLVGASLGGLASMVAVGESQEPIAAGLVLVDVVPRIEPAGAAKIGAFMSAKPEGFESVEEAADAVAAYLPHRKRPKDTSGLRKNLRERNGRYVWHWDPKLFGGRAPVRLQQNERLEAAARNLRVPTLLLRGRLSDIVSPEGVAHFRELAPHAEFVDIADAHHMVAGDDNNNFNAAVFEFLERHFPPKGKV